MYRFLPKPNPAQNRQALTYFFMVGYIRRRISTSPRAWYSAQGTSTQASPQKSMAMVGMVAGKP